MEVTTPCRRRPLGSEYFGRSVADSAEAAAAAAVVEAREEEEKERKGSEEGRQLQGGGADILVTGSRVRRSAKDMAS